jgi:hypothetical protein
VIKPERRLVRRCSLYGDTADVVLAGATKNF